MSKTAKQIIKEMRAQIRENKITIRKKKELQKHIQKVTSDKDAKQRNLAVIGQLKKQSSILSKEIKKHEQQLRKEAKAKQLNNLLEEVRKLYKKHDEITKLATKKRPSAKQENQLYKLFTDTVFLDKKIIDKLEKLG